MLSRRRAEFAGLVVLSLVISAGAVAGGALSYRTDLSEEDQERVAKLR